LVLGASEAVGVGLQAGLALPLPSDLTHTTSTGLNPSVGVHLDLRFMENHTLRLRVDSGSFSEGKQVSDGPVFKQVLRTKVKDTALGVEALYHPLALNPPWHIGVGIYAIRWTVASDEVLSVPNGTLPAASTSSWTREGLGVVCGYRIGTHLETDLRLITSRYGYEKQAVRVASLNLLWHF
jgi:hypothetical protein